MSDGFIIAIATTAATEPVNAEDQSQGLPGQVQPAERVTAYMQQVRPSQLNLHLYRRSDVILASNSKASLGSRALFPTRKDKR